ncbi:hypothetical protein KJ707_03875 [Patescibacteria group bacterium]|nr:hypothetical protein [Patescibacteria group bacterium]
MSKLAQKIDTLHKSGRTVFSTTQLALYWSTEHKRTLYVQISRAKKKGFLKSIQKGLYAINEVEVNRFELAGSLKKNSYISFETVMAKESIINQWYGSYFSASNRKMKIKNEYGTFEYKRLPERILNNRLGIINTGTYFITTPERAVCDYVYKSGLQPLDDINELDLDELIRISKIYECKRLESDIKQLTKLVL